MPAAEKMSSEHVVVVRVYDRFDNIVVEDRDPRQIT